jgi:hypothetical protein
VSQNWSVNLESIRILKSIDMIIRNFNKLFRLILCCTLPALLMAQTEPVGPKSEVREWEKMKYGMFIHFNMNTFAHVEYDNGKMPATAFAPDKLDVGQWIRTAKDAGMKYAVLTAKHTYGRILFMGQQGCLER